MKERLKNNLLLQLDVEVDMPDEIDLSCLLKSSGKHEIAAMCASLLKLKAFGKFNCVGALSKALILGKLKFV